MDTHFRKGSENNEKLRVITPNQALLFTCWRTDVFTGINQIDLIKLIQSSWIRANPFDDCHQSLIFPCW